MALNDAPATVPALVEDIPPRSRRADLLRLPNPTRARRGDWEQLARFCVVGGTGYIVNLAVFWLLVSRSSVHHLVAAVLAFAVAWVSNFVLNKFWTFRIHTLPVAKQGLRYLVVSLIGLALNLALLQLLVLGDIGKVLSQAIAIAAVMPLNFLLNRRWSFR
ncbi:MAG: GtrA family protein [Actinobacteria bacterium]|nr:GtrA family protein [Actinomycetota bacterium]